MIEHTEEGGAGAAGDESAGSGALSKRVMRESLLQDVGPAAASDSPAMINGEAAASSAAGSGARHLQRAPSWAVTANNVAFMCVPRAIPACLAATGWALGLTVLAYSCVVTYDTGLLIGRACAMRPNFASFPELMGEGCATWAGRRGWTSATVDFARAVGYRATLALQFMTYYLTAVAELIYFEQYCGQLFEWSPICQWQWLLIISAVSLPILQIPSYHESRWVALVIGVAPLALNVLIFAYEARAPHTHERSRTAFPRLQFPPPAAPHFSVRCAGVSRSSVELRAGPAVPSAHSLARIPRSHRLLVRLRRSRHVPRGDP